MNIFIMEKKAEEQRERHFYYPEEVFPSILRRFGLAEENKIGWGSWRRTYELGDMVIKLPYNSEGVTEQLLEYALYTENLEFLRKCAKFYYRDGFRYFYAYHKALGLPLPLNPCELEWIDGLSVLMAPKLIPVHHIPDFQYPWWCWLTDSYQAGVVKVGMPALLYDYNAWFGAKGFLEDLEKFHPGDYIKIWEQMQQCMEAM